MITREEYNKALDIVEAYQKQIFISINSDSGKTRIKNWHLLKKCSTRLVNVLTNGKFEYIEDIISKEYYNSYLGGKKGWYEFQRLRGY